MNKNIAWASSFWRCVALSFVIFCAASGSKAQTLPTPAPPDSLPTDSLPAPQASPSPSLARRFIKNILRDQKMIWTSPLHLSGNDARWLAPLGVTTALMIATDRRSAGAVNNGEMRLKVSHNISRIGAAYTTGGISAAFYLAGRFRNNARARETGLLSAQAWIDGGIVSLAFKELTQRSRPLNDNGRGRFFTSGRSFPSGHSTSAWSLATIIDYEYGKRRPVVRVAAYGLATVISISRFTGRSHFLSDTLVGSALGYGIGRYVYYKYHDPSLDGASAQDAATHSKLLPLITPSYNSHARSYGVRLVWSF